MAGHDDTLVEIGVQESSPPAVSAISNDIVLAVAHELHVEVVAPT